MKKILPNRFSRRQALRDAIDKVERKFPVFRDSGFQPVAGSAEEQAFEEYKVLKERSHREDVAVIARRLVERAKADDARADAALARMDLLPVSLEEETVQASTASGTPVSLKQERGEICDQVIREAKFLRSEILRLRTNFTFGALRDSYPSLTVLEILSKPPFDDDDRELICHPHQWGRSATYATGLLKRYFGVQSEETIRSYRKAYKGRFRLTPLPAEASKNNKRRRRSRRVSKR